MKVILICGHSFSGKTTASNYLISKGHNVFISDDYVNELYKPDHQGYLRIKENFGENFVDEKEVKRRSLSRIVFSNEEQMKLLNIIIQPLIVKGIEEFVKKNSTKNIVFIESKVAIDYSGYYSDLFTEVIAVKASSKTINQRLNNSKKKNIKKNLKKINYDDYYIKTTMNYENVVILENNSTLDDLYINIERIVNEFTRNK